MKHRLKIVLTVVALLSIGAMFTPASDPRSEALIEPRLQDTAEPSWMKYRTGRQPVVGLADADRLREQYETWKAEVPDPWLVDLVPTSLLGADGARGYLRVDPEREEIVSWLRGLEPRPLDLWLIDNADWPDNPALPDPEDRAIRVGTYVFDGGTAVLEVSASDLTSREFSIDVVLVTPAGASPFETAVFHGSPALFQRLAALEDRMQREADRKSTRLLGLAVAAMQSGGVPTGFPAVFTDLVTEGEDLFFNETFEGNGRTCGTCHFAVNNFTIDADLIARLPPNDPLFAAEFRPPLIFGHPQNLDTNGRPRRFENPALMRAFGLIVENLDGFGDLEKRFTMRGVPHNVGMLVSVERTPGSISFPEGPDERTGWSGDGSPFGVFGCGPVVIGPGGTTSGGIVVRGTTRSFALGAVIQHFPLTLERNFCAPNADFRLPTDAELDAFEAFFFGLGRKVDLVLDAGAPKELILADAGAEMGKVLFREPAASGNAITCNNCHTNAGANSFLFNNTNANFDTNVEEFLQNRITDPTFTVVGQPRPIDGGFGLNPDGNFKELKPGPGNGNENFGDGSFNTVSLVEAADSAPFFHANIAFDVEGSIDFYASDEFAENFPRIVFTTQQRDQVAAFMRAINALDNVENLAIKRANKAITAIQVSNPNDNDVINFLLEVAIADTQDAIEVLQASHLHDKGGLPVNAVLQLTHGKQRLMQAQNTNLPDPQRIAKIQEGVGFLQNAVGIIRVNP